MHIEKCSINIKFALNIYQRKRKKKPEKKRKKIGNSMHEKNCYSLLN